MPLCPYGLIGPVSPLTMRRIDEHILVLKNGSDAVQINEISLQITRKLEFL